MKSILNANKAPISNDSVVAVYMSIAEAQCLADYCAKIPSNNKVVYLLYSALNDVGFEPLPLGLKGDLLS